MSCYFMELCGAVFQQGVQFLRGGVGMGGVTIDARGLGRCRQQPALQGYH